MPKGGNRSLGEDRARAIAEECYDEVLAYCKRHAPAGHEAADLAQETFLRFVRAGSYRERGKPIAYLLRIARNVCVDASRRRRLETVALDFDVADEAATPADGAEADLAAALAKLPDDLRETIELRFGAGLGVTEVGKVLGISRFAVNRRINAALKMLGELLDEEQKEGSTR